MIRTFVFRLSILISCLLFAAMAATAGPSATAVTTISANIVPIASFSGTDVLQLNALVDNITARRHSIQPGAMQGEGVILGGSGPVEFRIDGNQNLEYDISVPSSTRISDRTGSVSTDIEHISREDYYDRDASQYIMKIDEAVLKDRDPKAGQYRGLIDITVNYN